MIHYVWFVLYPLFVSQLLHFIVEVAYRDTQIVTNLMICFIIHYMFEFFNLYTSDIKQSSTHLSSVSMTKGFCMIFVGIIHSHDESVLNTWWMYRRVVNKMIPITLICFGLTCFRKSVPNYLSWVLSRFSKITRSTFLCISFIWMFRLYITNWYDKYKFISNVENSQDSWRYTIFLSYLLTSNCIGAMWFITVFACIIFASHFMHQYSNQLIALAFYVSAACVSYPDEVMSFEKWIRFLTQPCCGQKLMYHRIYWPRWAIYVIVGMHISKLSWFSEEFLTKHFSKITIIFILCELLYEKEIVTNKILFSMLDMCCNIFLTFMLMTTNTINFPIFKKWLCYIGDNSWHIYIGHIIALNIFVSDFTIAEIRYLPNRIPIFSSVSLALGLIVCWMKDIRLCNFQKSTLPNNKYHKEKKSRKKSLIFTCMVLFLATCTITLYNVGTMPAVENKVKETAEQVKQTVEQTVKQQAVEQTVEQTVEEQAVEQTAEPVEQTVEYFKQPETVQQSTVRYKKLIAKKENAIFTLIKGGSLDVQYNDYSERCKQLRTVLHKNNYEDIAFHEGNVPSKIQQRLSATYSVRFENVVEYGGFTLENPSWNKTLRGPSEYNIGYKHMCRFFALQWMHIMRDYNYVMRIDEDVLVHSMQDPFASSHIYSYALLTTEKHDETLDTFQVWMNQYVKSRNLQQYNVKDMYFTNVFLTKVSFWLQDNVQKFLTDIDNTGHIYLHRWGDAPIQTAALTLFGKKHVSYFRVDYSHASTANEIRNGREIRYVQKNVQTDFDAFNNMFQQCVAPCLVCNAFKLGSDKITQVDDAMSLLRGDFMLRTGHSYEVANVYSPYQLALAYQVDIRRQPYPLPPDSMKSLDRIKRFTELLNLPSNADDSQRLEAAENHICCQKHYSKKFKSAFNRVQYSNREKMLKKLYEEVKSKKPTTYKSTTTASTTYKTSTYKNPYKKHK